MKAKIKPRINLEDRTPLQDVIPLSTPMIVFLDPSSVCNFKCKFCPTGYIDIIRKTNRYQDQMNFVLYKKIIDSLDEFDKPINILRLYKDGEPLLNKNFVNMIQYAKESGFVNYIDTTTNGYLLNPDLNKEILDAELDRINISVNGISDEQFLQFSGIKVDFDKYVDNIRNFYKTRENGGYRCEICVKIAGDYISEDDKKHFYDTFGDYSDRIFIENIAPCWPNFNVEDRLKDIDKDFKINQTKGIYNQIINKTGHNICAYIFYSMSVNSDGTVSACFLDWEHKLLVGDVRKQSLKSIWKGEKLFQYQLENLRGRRTDTTICKNCNQLIYGLPDNIDPYANILLEKLLMSRKCGQKI